MRFPSLLFRNVLTAEWSVGASLFRRCLNPVSCLALALLAALVVGIGVSPTALIAAGIIGAVLVIGLVWPWLSLRGIVVSAKFASKRGREAEATDFEITVVNRWPLPVWGLLIEGLGESEQTLALASVPGWTRVAYRFPFIPMRRGVYPQQPLTIVTGFPFGVWRVRRSLHVSDKLIVWPKVYEMDVALSALGSHGSGELMSDRRAGTDGDVMGTRPFRRGDLLRDIHWAQTVRQRRWIVTERQSTTWLRTTLDVDWRALSPEQNSPHSVLEWQIRTVASLVTTLAGTGVDVELQLGDSTWVFGPNGQDVRRLLDELARLSPNHSSPGKNIDGVQANAEPPPHLPGSQANQATRLLVTTTTNLEQRKAARHYEQVWIVSEADPGIGTCRSASTKSTRRLTHA